MLRRIPRILRQAIVIAVLVAVSATVYQSWSAGSPGSGGWVQTEYGPLGPADRDLLVRIRQAGLWEGPTAQQAEQQASSAEVKDVARKIADEHAQLDVEVRQVADQLGVLLPSGATAQQHGWMDEITSHTGSDYDRVFVQRLREAHGIVLPIIAEVRANTRNDLVREFAVTAAEFVNRHHAYLESTGLVDYSALPHHGPGLFGGGTDLTDLIVPMLVFVAALLIALALFWALRTRAGGRRGPPVRTAEPRLPELTALPAIPSPRRAPRDDDTGPIPVADISRAPGPTRFAAAPHAGDPGTNGAGVPDPDTADPDNPDPDDVDAAEPRSGSTDSGSLGAVSSSGSHRLPRSRARHSMRR